jgi:hypothetical protein
MSLKTSPNRSLPPEVRARRIRRLRQENGKNVDEYEYDTALFFDLDPGVYRIEPVWPD